MSASPPSVKSEFILQYDCKKGVALCIGIDKQYYLEPHYNLGKIAANSTEAMGKALVNQLGLHHDQVKIRISSVEKFHCTKSGIKFLFKKNAKNIEEGGIFIFYYVGHCFYDNTDR